ncbi:MAG: hypothetical protein JWO33_1721 [Caulobacteraceae bacterium]|nr:hypothetical protein [Caulobacteraceae bacterium]
MRSFMTDPSLAESLIPAFSWAELEDRLMELAPTRVKKAMVPALVSAVRKQSWAVPPAQVLDEILALAWVLNDETFQPELGSEFPQGIR